MKSALIIAVLFGLFAILIYYFFFKKSSDFVEDTENHLTIDYLSRGIMQTFDDILKTNYSEMNLNRDEITKAEINKTKLRKNLKLCKFGNYAAKLYIRDYIQDLLQRKYKVNEDSINEFIPFNNYALLTSQDKWEILVHIYKLNFGLDAVSQLIKQMGLDSPKNSEEGDIYYEVSVLDLNSVFVRHSKAVAALTFLDKLTILAQRVYQINYGHGVVDDIRDMVIDGFNCGTSGISVATYEHGRSATFGAERDELPLATYNAIWLMLSGKKIRLACLGFLSEKELQRVARNIYRYGDPGTLSMSAPKIVSEGQDGCRIVVIRPPMSSSWCFFVRKFDVASKMPFHKLYPFPNVDDLKLLCQMIMSGTRNVGITGQQATGKSTFLMSIAQFFQSSYSIRTQEMAFELNLQKIYPRRNIVALRETASVSGQEGIDIQKKTDGDINLIGEVADYQMSMLATQTGMVGSAQTVYTHHAKTPQDLITYHRDAMIVSGGFNNEKLAEATVVNVHRFNINLIRTPEGKRIVNRITEIIPLKIEDYPDNLEQATIEYFRRQTDRPTYVCQDLMIGTVDGGFKFCGEFSEDQREAIRLALPLGLKEKFDVLLEKMHEGALVNSDIAIYKDPYRYKSSKSNDFNNSTNLGDFDMSSFDSSSISQTALELSNIGGISFE